MRHRSEPPEVSADEPSDVAFMLQFKVPVGARAGNPRFAVARMLWNAYPTANRYLAIHF